MSKIQKIFGKYYTNLNKCAIIKKSLEYNNAKKHIKMTKVHQHNFFGTI